MVVYVRSGLSGVQRRPRSRVENLFENPKVNAQLRRRLDQLERNTHLKRVSMSEEITAAALTALSDEELEQLRPYADREPPLLGCTPEQNGQPLKVPRSLPPSAAIVHRRCNRGIGRSYRSR